MGFKIALKEDALKMGFRGGRVHRAPDGHAKEVTDTRSDNEVSSRSETRARTDVRGHIARVLLLQSMQMLRMQVGTFGTRTRQGSEAERRGGRKGMGTWHERAHRRDMHATSHVQI